LKKISRMVFISILLLFILPGCQPKPKISQKNLSLENIHLFQVKKVSASTSNLLTDKKPSLSVHYQTNGNNLLVECIVTGISFREMDQSKENIGKLVIWLDGRKKQEAAAAAFILKDLSKGKHHLKLEVVNLQNKPYGLSKEFEINIHND
jgi:hypothetical protein